MSDSCGRGAGDFAGAHIGGTRAFVVHVSFGGELVERSGGNFRGVSRGIGARDEAAGARRVAGHAYGIERASDFAVVGVGRASSPRAGLPVHTACELAAALERGEDFRGVGCEARATSGEV